MTTRSKTATETCSSLCSSGTSVIIRVTVSQLICLNNLSSERKNKRRDGSAQLQINMETSQMTFNSPGARAAWRYARRTMPG
jgi:hypothetical protein